MFPTAPPALLPSAVGAPACGGDAAGGVFGRAPPAGWPVPAVSAASEMAAPAARTSLVIRGGG